MSDSIIIDGMSKKKTRTVPVHARIAESDVAEVDKAADQNGVTRSLMISLIVRQWVNGRVDLLQRPSQRSPKKS